MDPKNRIEKALAAHERANPAENYFERYAVLKQRLLTNEYTQVASGFPGGNDHGPGHITRVLEYLDILLGEDQLRQLDPYELFIAMMAVLYHDVGILAGRDEHARKSGAILLLESNEYVFDAYDKELIHVAVVSHSSSVDIEQQCSRYEHEEHVRGRRFRMRVVASLVRLADELDEDARRADQSLARKLPLPEHSEFYWRFNQRVTGIKPDAATGEIRISMSFKAEDLATFYPESDRSFVERAAGKLVKLNAEVAKCSRHLPDGLKYSGIRLTLRPFPDHPQWKRPAVVLIRDGMTANELLRTFPTELIDQTRATAGLDRTAKIPHDNAVLLQGTIAAASPAAPTTRLPQPVLSHRVLDRQFEQLTELVTIFEGKSEMDLRADAGFQKMLWLNWLHLMDDYAIIALGLTLKGSKPRPYRQVKMSQFLKEDALKCLTVVDDHMLDDAATKVPDAAPTRISWSEYRYVEIGLSDEYIDLQERLRKFAGSAFLPQDCIALIKNYTDTLHENSVSVHGVLNEAARELPEKYPTLKTWRKASIEWIRNRYNKKFIILDQVAEPIVSYVRRYLQVDSVLKPKE